MTPDIGFLRPEVKSDLATQGPGMRRVAALQDARLRAIIREKGSPITTQTAHFRRTNLVAFEVAVG